ERELEGIDLSRWRVAGCGAEPIRAETLEAFASTFAAQGFRREAFVASYGMAEATLAVSFSGLGEGLRIEAVATSQLSSQKQARPPESDADATKLVSCGRPFRDHQVAVFDPEDVESERPLSERTVGELRLRGPSVMRGYYDDSELSRSAFAGGWLKT